MLGCCAITRSMEAHSASLFIFGDCQLDCRSRELRKGGVRIRVQHQPFQVLAMLVAADGDVVTRDELRDGIWPRDTHVDFDRSINKAVNRLRQLLSDDVDHPRFIETVPKRGYRFLSPVVRAARRPQPATSDVSETLLKARHFGSKRTAEDLRRSIDYFRRAIEREPECAAAWAGLAEAYVLTGLFGLQPPHDAFPAAQTAAQRALTLDRSVVAAHTALGDVHKFYAWDWNAAESAYRRAIANDPTYPVAHHWYAQLLAIQGRHVEAIKEIEEARRCDPVSVPVNAFVSYVWLQAREYERAITAAHTALELDANAPLTHFLLGRAYASANASRKALAAMKTAARLAGTVPLINAYLGYAYARAGFLSRAHSIRDELANGPLATNASAFYLAITYVGLGERHEALTSLKHAYGSRAPMMIGIGDPLFSELASEPVYLELLASLRLPNLQ
jgi:DNA-binding winged helix-turn-helix (wHTH) protein